MEKKTVTMQSTALYIFMAIFLQFLFFYIFIFLGIHKTKLNTIPSNNIFFVYLDLSVLVQKFSEKNVFICKLFRSVFFFIIKCYIHICR